MGSRAGGVRTPLLVEISPVSFSFFLLNLWAVSPNKATDAHDNVVILPGTTNYRCIYQYVTITMHARNIVTENYYHIVFKYS